MLGQIAGLFLATVLTTANPAIVTIFDNGQALIDDQFASLRPVPPLNDRIVELPFNDQRGDWPAHYKYVDGKLSLSVFVVPSEEVVVFSTFREKGSFIGANAYGRRARVSAIESATLAISFDSSDDFKIIDAHIERSLPPDEARRLATAARLQFEFADPNALSGRPFCKHDRTEASLDNPEQVDDLRCVIRSDVKAVRVVDSRTGEVLSTLLHAPPK